MHKITQEQNNIISLENVIAVNSSKIELLKN